MRTLPRVSLTNNSTCKGGLGHWGQPKWHNRLEPVASSLERHHRIVAALCKLSCGEAYLSGGTTSGPKSFSTISVNLYSTSLFLHYAGRLLPVLLSPLAVC